MCHWKWNLCDFHVQTGRELQNIVGELEERFFSCDHLHSVDFVCSKFSVDEPVFISLQKLLTDNDTDSRKIRIRVVKPCSSTTGWHLHAASDLVCANHWNLSQFIANLRMRGNMHVWIWFYCSSCFIQRIEHIGFTSILGSALDGLVLNNCG